MDQAKNLSELTQKILKDVADGDNLFVDDFEQQRRLIYAMLVNTTIITDHDVRSVVVT